MCAFGHVPLPFYDWCHNGHVEAAGGCDESFSIYDKIVWAFIVPQL